MDVCEFSWSWNVVLDFVRLEDAPSVWRFMSLPFPSGQIYVCQVIAEAAASVIFRHGLDSYFSRNATGNLATEQFSM
jgi:hypothetical protein